MQPYTLYRSESDDPTRDAQRNLTGRTYYVEPETLRFHGSRILETYVVDGGCLFAFIESYSADYQNTTRRRRFVVFDVTGWVVKRVNLEDGWRTTKQARAAMWECLNSLDARAITAAAIERERENVLESLDLLWSQAWSAILAR